MGEYNVANGTKFDATEAKQTVLDYCLRKGALAAGVADLDALELIAPPGHRPSDIMPKIKSVISLGVGGQTQGAWAVPAKAMGYFGSTETRAYTISYGAAFFIESKYQTPAIYCPPDMDNEKGPRVPLQSLKLHAEVAGIGARSLAGDILLEPEFGLLYYGSVYTEMPLAADEPMADNPCPASSCVKLYKESGQTPCQKFCPVQCLSGELNDDGTVAEMNFDMYRCAELCQQYENMPTMIERAFTTNDQLAREEMLYGAEAQSFFYKATAGVDTNAQCFECMRVCPIATQGKGVDPIRRGAAAREAAGMGGS